MTNAVREYVHMVQGALAGEVELGNFGRTFMDKFSSDQTSWSQSVFKILNDVYLDCDEFESDPELHVKLRANLPNFVINTNEFEKRLQANLEKLLAQI